LEHGSINLATSDLIFKGRVLLKVLMLGFGGGSAAGALGLGGGTIFGPGLLHLGVPPKVTSATGQYMITFGKISTTCLYLLFGELCLDYALWVGAWSAASAIIGLAITNWYMRRFKR